MRCNLILFLLRKILHWNFGGVMIATPFFKFCAKSQMRLEAASNILWLYNTVVRAITNTMIQWYPIINDFKQEWKNLVKWKGEDVSDVPNIIKVLPIIKQTDFFRLTTSDCSWKKYPVILFHRWILYCAWFGTAGGER